MAGDPIRVLVVDDSIVARHLVAKAIDSDPALVLAGMAANGRVALDHLSEHRPDIIVLDLEMPVLDGFATLRELRASHPNLPVVMFSSLTAHGASATLEALALGADGFALKPAAGQATDTIREDLLPLLKALVAAPGSAWRAARDAPQAAPARTAALAATRTGPICAVLIGVSTGGPNLLATMLSEIPASFPAPILIVQHMPPVFTRMLATRLDATAELRVVEAEDGMVPQPGWAYIAPGGHHMGVRRVGSQAQLRIHDGPPENSCRPAVDVLFREAAKAYGSGLLAVILTGMGQDGTAGARAVAAGGGIVLVQDPATAVVGSMPAAVIAAGLADIVVPVARVASEIDRAVQRARR